MLILTLFKKNIKQIFYNLIQTFRISVNSEFQANVTKRSNKDILINDILDVGMAFLYEQFLMLFQNY